MISKIQAVFLLVGTSLRGAIKTAQKLLIVSIILVSTIHSTSVLSKDITDQSFVGKWCGQWDGIYTVCLTIDSVESGAIAQYQWLERPKSKFKKSKKTILRINRNTLKIDNIYFALDENNHHQANAMGIFQFQTRIAILTKQDLTTMD